MTRRWLWLAALLVVLVSYPPQWYPMPVRVQLTRWFGAADFHARPASMEPVIGPVEEFCPPDPEGWRESHEIEGVAIEASPTCAADNPWAIAAFVRGTNKVSPETLMKSGLTSDTLEIGRDLDGDGDPDEIHIRLEVTELNGGSNILPGPVTRYEIAPGIRPGLWVFAPKFAGMAVENFESQQARPDLRLPSPAIHVEQGDHIYITLENTHYMPHTLHLHGADHGFVDASGEGNDGVPLTSEMPVMPGASRTYELEPRQTGAMLYHCHVQPHVHVMMGLQGMFVIEENRPDNWLQTLNIGAGQVRVRSQSSQDEYDREYDLHYLDLDKQLGERIQENNDPRLISRSVNRDYDITDATQDYFTLNGRSFPYTFRESLLIGKEDAHIKLRVLNGGAKGIALHTHGHKFTMTHHDGGEIPEGARSPQDVAWLATTERMEVDLELHNDGLHAYGPGIWLFHDHQYQGITTDGIGPGGNISAIVYDDYLDDSGWPRTQGVSWDNYFTEAYYRKEVPVWRSYAPVLFDDAGIDLRLLLRILALASAVGVLAALALNALYRRFTGQ